MCAHQEAADRAFSGWISLIVGKALIADPDFCCASLIS
jgi:hypothetical protein